MMNCPICTSPHGRVIDSRNASYGIRRRRVCDACGNRWTTQEAVAMGELEAIELLRALKEDLSNALLRAKQAIEAIELRRAR